MFSKDSILYEVNIFSKVISIFISLIGIILLKNDGLIVLLGVLFLFLSKEYKYLFRFNIFVLSITILSTFVPIILWLTKILLFIDYVCLVLKTIYSSDLRYLLEKTLYKFNNKKITYKVLKMIYFIKYMKKNYAILKELLNEYGIAKKNNLYFLHKRAYLKTKDEITELMTMFNLRFYNSSKDRTYMEKIEFERWDTKYIVFHILVLVFIIIYGGLV